MTKEETLESVIRDIWWMARRYADGRSSYAPGLFNDAMRRAIDAGMVFRPDRNSATERTARRLFAREKSEEIPEHLRNIESENLARMEGQRHD